MYNKIFKILIKKINSIILWLKTYLSGSIRLLTIWGLNQRRFDYYVSFKEVYNKLLKIWKGKITTVIMQLRAWSKLHLIKIWVFYKTTLRNGIQYFRLETPRVLFMIIVVFQILGCFLVSINVDWHKIIINYVGNTMSSHWCITLIYIILMLSSFSFYYPKYMPYFYLLLVCYILVSLKLKIYFDFEMGESWNTWGLKNIYFLPLELYVIYVLYPRKFILMLLKLSIFIFLSFLILLWYKFKIFNPYDGAGFYTNVVWNFSNMDFVIQTKWLPTEKTNQALVQIRNFWIHQFPELADRLCILFDQKGTELRPSTYKSIPKINEKIQGLIDEVLAETKKNELLCGNNRKIYSFLFDYMEKLLQFFHIIYNKIF